MTGVMDEVSGSTAVRRSAKVHRIAYQGFPGAFSEEAAQLVFGATANTLPFQTFADVAMALRAGELELAVLPVANTVVGTVDASVDAIRSIPHVRVVAEVALFVRHQLLTVPGATWAHVRTVESQSVALDQCAR